MDALRRISTLRIYGTDVHILRGEYPFEKGLAIGHEPVGINEETRDPGAQIMFKPAYEKALSAAVMVCVGWLNRRAASPLGLLVNRILTRSDGPATTLDLEPVLRREMELPRQPALIASNDGDTFTVTADLQNLGIDSLHMELTPDAFTLSGWVTQQPGETAPHDATPLTGRFESARIIPPSMDLDNFTIGFKGGVLKLSVPKKRRDSRPAIL